jgi:electron transfer flavoprotein beta subunit
MAAGKTAWRISRYDEYALEMALRLKDEDGVSRIDVLAVGDNAASEVLKRSIGMGADHGVLIEQSGHLFQSPLTIGGLIADYARGRGYHLILCGVMSEDLMQGLVGPIIAGLRDWPCLTSVQVMSLPNRSAKLICEREIEGGRLEVLEMPLPALVTVQSGRHPPRYPALSKLLRANRHALEILPERTLVTPEAKQGSHSIRWPIKTRQGNRLEGSAEEKAQQLAAMLRARGFC